MFTTPDHVIEYIKDGRVAEIRQPVNIYLHTRPSNRAIFLFQAFGSRLVTFRLRLTSGVAGQVARCATEDNTFGARLRFASMAAPIARLESISPTRPLVSQSSLVDFGRTLGGSLRLCR